MTFAMTARVPDEVNETRSWKQRAQMPQEGKLPRETRTFFHQHPRLDHSCECLEEITSRPMRAAPQPAAGELHGRFGLRAEIHLGHRS